MSRTDAVGKSIHAGGRSRRLVEALNAAIPIV